MAQGLQQGSALAWVYLNQLKNENQKPIDFTDHRFMLDIYADDADDIVSRKSAQVGFSVYAILKSFHDCQYKGLNVIYALPTKNVVNDFVKPKVNPLITSNPVIAGIVKDDSVSYKRIGDRNLFFKGGFSDREAISITGDVLVIDEYDRMPDSTVVNTFDSRLQASASPMRRRFSNPSALGYGVDMLYAESDQRHWFVQCSHCNHQWYMEWEKGDGAHYVDKQREIYACGKCNREIYDKDRRNGYWLAKYPQRNRHGYWFSQMMAPWVSAKRILEQYEESGADFFHNFVLGKAYTPSDLVVNRETVLRACSPSSIEKREVAMGVDNGVLKTYVIGTPDGIFAHGQTESWEEIEKLKLMYNATMVMDPNPYPTTPKMLCDKYKGSAYICYFKEDTTNLGVIRWGTGVNAAVVYADRTKLIDLIAQEKVDVKMLYRERPDQLEDVITHWNNLYRTTVEKEDGRIKSTWLKKDGKMSDYPFAEAYFRIALTKTMGRGEVSRYLSAPAATMRPVEATHAGYTTDLSNDLQEALDA